MIWPFITSRLAGPIASGVAGVLLIATVWLWVGKHVADGKVHGLTVDRDRWRANAVGWQAYGRSEKLAFDTEAARRASESKRALQALDGAALACDARVARARASALAIHSITTKEPRRDPNGCPVRALADPGELRTAITGQGAQR
jgi:hypothetical protein